MNGLQYKTDDKEKVAATNGELQPSDLEKNLINEMTQAKNEAMGRDADELWKKQQQQMIDLGDRLKQCKIALNTLQYKESTVEERIQAIDLIQFHVEDNYVANDFVKIGGLAYIIEVLKEQPILQAIPIITTSAIENEYIQNELLNLGAIKLFLNFFEGNVKLEDPKKENDLKYLSTSAIVSMLCTNNKIYEELVEKQRFFENDALYTLLHAKTAPEHPKLKNKLHFLMDCLISHPENLQEERQKYTINHYLKKPLNDKLIPLLLENVNAALQDKKQIEKARSNVELLTSIAMLNQIQPCITAKSSKAILSTILSSIVTLKKATDCDADDVEDYTEIASELVNDYGLASIKE
mmetsp:Transcript_11794/g.17514  ORF Transcript_11794/g.17514 Transcript_11794/m.17514 type:complete len:352 (+) Transcript_11794:45-1100(+)